MIRLLVALGLVVVGLATGTATVLLHSVPWTFAFALVTTAVTGYAAPPRWWARAAYCVAWTLAVTYLSLQRPEGDLLVARTSAGYLLLYGAAPVVLVLGTLSTLLAPRRPQTVLPPG